MQNTKQRPWGFARRGHSDHHKASRAQSSGGHSGSGAGKGRTGEFLAFASVPLTLVLGNSMLVPVLPELETALGVSNFQSSLVITLFSVTAGLFIPVLGYLSDRFSRKAVMIPSLIVYGAAGVLAGFGAAWGSYPVVIGARALQGIGAAGTAPIAMALIGDTYQGGTETKALGLIEASNGAGKVVSPILGSLLALIVWYASFFAFPVFCLLSLLGVIFLIHEPDKKKSPQKLGAYVRNILKVFKQKGRWLISSFVTGSLGLFTLFGILFYLSDILEKEPYNIDGVMKGLVLAIPLLGLVVTSYTTGALVKKNGKLMRKVMLIGLAGSTLALAACIWLYGNIWLFISLLTLSSIGTGLLLPCLNTMITGSVEKSGRGMVTSLYSSLRFLGVAFGPPLFERMMSVSNELVFIVVSGLSLAGLALVFFFIRPPREVS
ncbi:MFS transporter [Paenibacillus thermoaerophilus]|uniref:MFS transporter n=1 Tax=Paenibacillus thermoaerophilus TaxID=1215385 RepID=A0ABW2V5F7_9BACL|nr:MFS transporter [Paenibacillus thermoaerophilus]TMV17833.1 MFS transporter [Paenibacillus thermoaerophilus]